MINRIAFAAAVVAGTALGSSAYASSPYYTDQGPAKHVVRKHVVRRLPSGAQTQGGDYRAAVPDESMGAPAAPSGAGPTVKMTPDGHVPPEAPNSFFNHAVGTDGSP